MPRTTPRRALRHAAHYALPRPWVNQFVFCFLRRLTPGLIITTAPGTEKTQTRSRGSPSTRGHAGSVSLHAHIPGDIASFTTQHGAEGAVLTTTSQCEFRSLAYL